jgi:hypothetical protein
MFPKPAQWIVTPEWKAQTAYIVGGGPSVKQQNLELLRGRNVIALNSSYSACPFAQFLFFGDARWYLEHRRKEAFNSFAGRIVTCSQTVRGPKLLGLFRTNPPPGFDERPTHVASQRTNLQGAMNLAAHLGVKRIVLLGADMRRAEDGSSHHHEPHPWPNAPGNGCWDLQMEQLSLIIDPLAQRGIEVINTSLVSRLDWWTKLTLEQAIEMEKQDGI